MALARLVKVRRLIILLSQGFRGLTHRGLYTQMSFYRDIAIGIHCGHSVSGGFPLKIASSRHPNTTQRLRDEVKERNFATSAFSGGELRRTAF